MEPGFYNEFYNGISLSQRELEDEVMTLRAQLQAMTLDRDQWKAKAAMRQNPHSHEQTLGSNDH